jgi:hypothetical protein
MNRRNQILALILAVQLVIVAVILWPRPTASGSTGEPLFPDAAADEVTSLEISSGEGDSILLTKGTSGWILPEADDYPVLEDKVPQLLEKIEALTADRMVTQTSGSHKRLKVAESDFERRLTLGMGDGSEHTLYLGSSPSYGAIHVRPEGRDQVYLASDLTTFDAEVRAANWVERTYFAVPEEEIVAVTLENANGRFAFEKADDTWTMADLHEDEVFNENRFKQMLNRARTVTILEPLGKEEQAGYGLDSPNAVVTIQARNDEGRDQTYTLTVGAQDPEDNSYVVVSSESPYHIRVSEFGAKDLVEMGHDDFLELPPTPTPEVTPQG